MRKPEFCRHAAALRGVFFRNRLFLFRGEVRREYSRLCGFGAMGAHNGLLSRERIKRYLQAIGARYAML